MATQREEVLIQNIKDKLSTLSIKNNLGDQQILACMNDTLREMKLSSVDSIEVFSDVELYFELRSTYYALSRIRNSNLENFDYTTASDGMSIDKTDISKQIKGVMDEIDNRFLQWLSSYNSVNKSANTSTTWNRQTRTKESLS